MPLPIELFPGKEVWLDDLGEGGLSVSGSSRLELGTSTFLMFDFPAANATIEATGEVAWCQPGGRAGVRFTRIKPDSTAALKRWLKSQEAELLDVPPAVLPVRTERSNYGVSGEVAKLLGEIPSPKLTHRETLQVVGERMLRLTRATGAAIAWREDNNVVCQASAGKAPSIGIVLDLRSSLTGECYRTGNIVNLSDCENDSRTNQAVRRELDFRSLLIVPIRWQGEVIGIAEVFSPLPGNFEGGDILILDSLAEFVAQLYSRTFTNLASLAADPIR
jgi:putative methionine-R-sulfoxide reductase with GAF domain